MTDREALIARLEEAKEWLYTLVTDPEWYPVRAAHAASIRAAIAALGGATTAPAPPAQFHLRGCIDDLETLALSDNGQSEQRRAGIKLMAQALREAFVPAPDPGAAALRELIVKWHTNAEALKRAALNPRNGDLENALMKESASAQEYCIEQLEAALTAHAEAYGKNQAENVPSSDVKKAQ